MKYSSAYLTYRRVDPLTAQPCKAAPKVRQAGPNDALKPGRSRDHLHHLGNLIRRI